MRSVFEWFAQDAARSAVGWLVLGKGPSFAKVGDCDLTQWRTLALNHAARELPTDLAHVVDLDVIEQCGEAILLNGGVLVMPWQPHVDNRAGVRTLDRIVQEQRVLRRLDEEGRLLWYNLSSGRSPRAGSPIVRASFFSVELALALLAQAGVRRIRTLGVDGGASYSDAFADLADKTLLNNGWSSFDRQFESFPGLILRHGLDLAPLDVESPVRVYVAATEAQMLPGKVLEYSIRKHASMSTQVRFLHEGGRVIPAPKDAANRPRTPFSFQRFLIPGEAGHRGRAIYLDSDMQVFKDIRQLWTAPMGDNAILSVEETGDGRRPQFSVMLMDCAALPWDIDDIVARLDAGELDYAALVYQMRIGGKIARTLPGIWNSLERFESSRTALLHYTDMQLQPWLSTHNPLAHLWFEDLFEALDGGFIAPDLIADHVARGFVRPSLAHQVAERLADPALLSKAARRLDAAWRPPHEVLLGAASNPLRRIARWGSARLRRAVRTPATIALSRKLRNRMRYYLGQ